METFLEAKSTQWENDFLFDTYDNTKVENDPPSTDALEADIGIDEDWDYEFDYKTRTELATIPFSSFNQPTAPRESLLDYLEGFHDRSGADSHTKKNCPEKDKQTIDVTATLRWLNSMRTMIMNDFNNVTIISTIEENVETLLNDFLIYSAKFDDFGNGDLTIDTLSSLISEFEHIVYRTQLQLDLGSKYLNKMHHRIEIWNYCEHCMHALINFFLIVDSTTTNIDIWEHLRLLRLRVLVSYLQTHMKHAMRFPISIPCDTESNYIDLLQDIQYLEDLVSKTSHSPNNSNQLHIDCNNITTTTAATTTTATATRRISNLFHNIMLELGGLCVAGFYLEASDISPITGGENSLELSNNIPEATSKILNINNVGYAKRLTIRGPVDHIYNKLIVTTDDITHDNSNNNNNKNNNNSNKIKIHNQMDKKYTSQFSHRKDVTKSSNEFHHPTTTSCKIAKKALHLLHHHLSSNEVRGRLGFALAIFLKNNSLSKSSSSTHHHWKVHVNIILHHLQKEFSNNHDIMEHLLYQATSDFMDCTPRLLSIDLRYWIDSQEQKCNSWRGTTSNNVIRALSKEGDDDDHRVLTMSHSSPLPFPSSSSSTTSVSEHRLSPTTAPQFITLFLVSLLKTFGNHLLLRKPMHSLAVFELQYNVLQVLDCWTERQLRTLSKQMALLAVSTGDVEKAIKLCSSVVENPDLEDTHELEFLSGQIMQRYCDRGCFELAVTEGWRTLSLLSRIKEATSSIPDVRYVQYSSNLILLRIALVHLEAGSPQLTIVYLLHLIPYLDQTMDHTARTIKIVVLLSWLVEAYLQLNDTHHALLVLETMKRIRQTSKHFLLSHPSNVTLAQTTVNHPIPTPSLTTPRGAKNPSTAPLEYVPVVTTINTTTSIKAISPITTTTTTATTIALSTGLIKPWQGCDFESNLPRYITTTAPENIDLAELEARVLLRKGLFADALQVLFPLILQVELVLGMCPIAKMEQELLELARLYYLKGKILLAAAQPNATISLPVTIGSSAQVTTAVEAIYKAAGQTSLNIRALRNDMRHRKMVSRVPSRATGSSIDIVRMPLSKLGNDNVLRGAVTHPQSDMASLPDDNKETVERRNTSNITIASTSTLPFPPEAVKDETAVAADHLADKKLLTEFVTNRNGKKYKCPADLLWHAIKTFRRSKDAFHRGGDEVSSAKVANKIVEAHLLAVFCPVALLNMNINDALDLSKSESSSASQWSIVYQPNHQLRNTLTSESSSYSHRYNNYSNNNQDVITQLNLGIDIDDHNDDSKTNHTQTTDNDGQNSPLLHSNKCMNNCTARSMATCQGTHHTTTSSSILFPKDSLPTPPPITAGLTTSENPSSKSRVISLDESERVLAYTLEIYSTCCLPLGLLEVYLNMAEVKIIQKKLFHAVAFFVEARDLFLTLFVTTQYSTPRHHAKSNHSTHNRQRHPPSPVGGMAADGMGGSGGGILLLPILRRAPLPFIRKIHSILSKMAKILWAVSIEENKLKATTTTTTATATATAHSKTTTQPTAIISEENSLIKQNIFLLDLYLVCDWELQRMNSTCADHVSTTSKKLKQVLSDCITSLGSVNVVTMATSNNTTTHTQPTIESTTTAWNTAINASHHEKALATKSKEKSSRWENILSFFRKQKHRILSALSITRCCTSHCHSLPLDCNPSSNTSSSDANNSSLSSLRRSDDGKGKSRDRVYSYQIDRCLLTGRLSLPLKSSKPRVPQRLLVTPTHSPLNGAGVSSTGSVNGINTLKYRSQSTRTVATPPPTLEVLSSPKSASSGRVSIPRAAARFPWLFPGTARMPASLATSTYTSEKCEAGTEANNQIDDAESIAGLNSWRCMFLIERGRKKFLRHLAPPPGRQVNGGDLRTHCQRVLRALVVTMKQFRSTVSPINPKAKRVGIGVLDPLPGIYTSYNTAYNDDSGRNANSDTIVENVTTSATNGPFVSSNGTSAAAATRSLALESLDRLKMAVFILQVDLMLLVYHPYSGKSQAFTYGTNFLMYKQWPLPSLLPRQHSLHGSRQSLSSTLLPPTPPAPSINLALDSLCLIDSLLRYRRKGKRGVRVSNGAIMSDAKTIRKNIKWQSCIKKRLTSSTSFRDRDMAAVTRFLQSVLEGTDISYLLTPPRRPRTHSPSKSDPFHSFHSHDVTASILSLPPLPTMTAASFPSAVSLMELMSEEEDKEVKEDAETDAEDKSVNAGPFHPPAKILSHSYHGTTRKYEVTDIDTDHQILPPSCCIPLTIIGSSSIQHLPWECLLPDTVICRRSLLSTFPMPTKPSKQSPSIMSGRGMPTSRSSKRMSSFTPHDHDTPTPEICRPVYLSFALSFPQDWEAKEEISAFLCDQTLPPALSASLPLHPSEVTSNASYHDLSYCQRSIPEGSVPRTNLSIATTASLSTHRKVNTQNTGLPVPVTVPAAAAAAATSTLNEDEDIEESIDAFIASISSSKNDLKEQKSMIRHWVRQLTTNQWPKPCPLLSLGENFITTQRQDNNDNDNDEPSLWLYTQLQQIKLIDMNSCLHHDSPQPTTTTDADATREPPPPFQSLTTPSSSSSSSLSFLQLLQSLCSFINANNLIEEVVKDTTIDIKEDRQHQHQHPNNSRTSKSSTKERSYSEPERYQGSSSNSSGSNNNSNGHHHHHQPTTTYHTCSVKHTTIPGPPSASPSLPSRTLSIPRCRALQYPILFLTYCDLQRIPDAVLLVLSKLSNDVAVVFIPEYCYGWVTSTLITAINEIVVEEDTTAIARVMNSSAGVVPGKEMLLKEEIKELSADKGGTYLPSTGRKGIPSHRTSHLSNTSLSGKEGSSSSPSSSPPSPLMDLRSSSKENIQSRLLLSIYELNQKHSCSIVCYL